MKWPCRWQKGQKQDGQSLVEFALVLPMVLLLVLGVIDLGVGFKTYIALTNSAREGARWISIYPTDDEGAQARIAEEAQRVGLVAADAVVIGGDNGYVASISPNRAVGEKVTVVVEYDYQLLFGLVTALPEVPFAASSTMVVLYDE